ncbi:MAG: glycosyl hydrolase family 17 protein [Bacteroidota bacterium]|jgi:exo-beta-1,3-glucanase (GH17 family)
MNLKQDIIKIFVIISMIAVTASCAKEKSTVDNKQPVEPVQDIFFAKEHMGVNYGPFHYNGQNPGTQVPLTQIQTDLTLIANTFNFIRTYTVANGMDQVVPEAAARSIQVALGVHCYPNDTVSTKADIDLAVSRTAAFPSAVTAIVVGNETNLDGPNYVNDSTVAGYMDYVKQKLTAAGLTGITVSSCITGTGGLPGVTGNSHPCPQIMQRCVSLNSQGDQVIFMTIYPYYGQKYGGQNTPSDISGNMQWSHDNGMAQAEVLGLGVVIGEIGWPSSGNDSTMENAGNEGLNFAATLLWINGSNIYSKSYNTLWFSMFDEPWKTGEPFNVGPYWGLYAANGATQPKFTIPPLQ